VESLAKILVIGNYPPPMCGWAIQTKFVVEELRRRGHVCEVLKINENRQQPSPEYTDVQSGWDYLRKTFRYARRGYRLNVHMNAMGSTGYLLALAAVIAGRLGGRPALISFHGGLSQEYFPRTDRGLAHWMYRILFRLSGGIACNGGLIKDAIEQYNLGPVQVEDLPGFSPQYLRFERQNFDAPVEEFLGPRAPLIFCYVSFRPEYRLELVRAAMAKLRERHPNSGFVWLGFPAAELKEAQQWVSTWPAAERESLLLLGNLSHDQFLSLLTRCTAYLRPPACDGVAASVLEAIALKVPVVASENGRRPHGVVTYADTDADDMCAKLMDVVENLPEVKAALRNDPAVDNVARTADWLVRCDSAPPFWSESSAR
jgi:glycosyltransferase involved in cell wall biosynthesis